MSLLVQNFRKKANACKDKRMSSEKNFDVGYPTGYLAFDFQNGVKVSVKNEQVDFTYNSIGIVDGSFNLFIGRSGCGTSTIAKQMAANIIRPFPLGSIFEDSVEGGITHRRNEILTGFNPDEIQERLLIRNAGVTCESFYKRIKLIYDIKTSHVEEYKYKQIMLDMLIEKGYGHCLPDIITWMS